MDLLGRKERGSSRVSRVGRRDAGRVMHHDTDEVWIQMEPANQRSPPTTTQEEEKKATMVNLPPFFKTFKITTNMSTPSTTALQPAGDCFPDRNPQLPNSSAYPTHATDPELQKTLADVEADLYSVGRSVRFGLAPHVRVRAPAPARCVELPFVPGLHSVRMDAVWANGQQVLEAVVTLPSRRVCDYAVDPQAKIVTFVVTRRWSVPDKPHIVGGAALPFPRQFNWDLGMVVDSGEHSGVWVCRWPKVGEQLADSESVVDVCVEEEGDYWFGLGAEEGGDGEGEGERGG